MTGDPVSPDASPARVDPGLRARLASLWRGRAGQLARLTAALLPIYFLARRVRWRDVRDRALDVGVDRVALAFALLMMSAVVAALRWSVLLRAFGAVSVPPVTTLLRHTLVGTYYNMLPSGVAGDAVRAHRAREFTNDYTSSVTVVTLERLSGLFGLCIIAALTMVFGVAPGEVVGPLLGAGFAAGLGVSTALLLAPWILARRERLRAWVGRVPVVGAIALAIPRARAPWGLAAAVGLSIVTQSLVGSTILWLVSQLAPTVSTVACVTVVPAIILTTYVPITPAAIGQRELAFQYFLGLVGVPAAAAIASSLLYFAVVVAMGATGGVVVLAERARAPRRTS